jgi:hypothetical protein
VKKSWLKLVFLIFIKRNFSFDAFLSTENHAIYSVPWIDGVGNHADIPEAKLRRDGHFSSCVRAFFWKIKKSHHKYVNQVT